MEPNEKESTQEKVEPKKTPEIKMREIVIATDGNSINLIKAEVAGSLEMVAVLQALIERFRIKT